MNFFDEIDNFNDDLIALFPGAGSSSSSKPCYSQPWFCDPSWQPPPASSPSSSGGGNSGGITIGTQLIYNSLVVDKIFVFQCNSTIQMSCNSSVKIMVGVLFKPLLNMLPLPLGIPFEIRQINSDGSSAPPQFVKKYTNFNDPPHWAEGSNSWHPYAIFPIYFYIDNVVPRISQPITYEYSFYTSGVGQGGASQRCGIIITIPAGSCCTSNPDLQFLCVGNSKRNQLINFGSTSNTYIV